MKEKYLIIKGVKPDRLHYYTDMGKRFLRDVKYPVKVKVDGEYFSPDEWKKDARSLNITNMWRIINFEWKPVNLNLKYLL
jgi:hypothetical protein